MRTCAACQKQYPDDVGTCPVHGTALVSEDELSVSDTIAARASVASGAGGPSMPVVRSGAGSNPTPMGKSSPGERDSHSGPAPNDSIVGATLSDRYEVTRKVGEGGMGVVYEAKHTLIGKRVAIKVLLDKYAQKADIVARLQQEARLASSIGHEHIVDITDFGETHDGRTFVVMEYLDGESLAQLLQREGPLPPARVIAIARQIAGALGAAHGKGIVHRDMKPENVFMLRRGDKDFVKVVDFGISKALKPEGSDDAGSNSPRLTHTGMVLGTPLYMSPEQARGEDDLDHRIDVYAVGIIMYEMLTGEVPFRGGNYLSVISQVLSTEPKRPSLVRPDLQLSAALESVVLKAMAKDRAQRYASMAELDADLARLEKGEEVVSLSASQLGRAPKKRRGVALAWGVGVALLVGATVAVVLPLTTGEKKAAPSAAVPAAPVVDPPKPVVDPPKPEIEMVDVTVSSDPAGAQVYFGSVPQGATPLAFKVPKGAEKIELTLQKDGFDDALVPFFPTKNATLPTIKLIKSKKPGPHKPPGGSGKPGGGDKPPDSGGGETVPNGGGELQGWPTGKGK